jgi:hypothetical protein
MRAVTVATMTEEARWNVDGFRSLLQPGMGLQLGLFADAPFMSAKIIVLKSQLRGDERGACKGRLERERCRRKGRMSRRQ